MKFISVFIILYGTALNTFSQDRSQHIPTQIITPLIYHEKVESPAYIDSALFSNYINWSLQKDSLPQKYQNGLGFSIIINYFVSKEGEISEVKPYPKGGYDDDLFQLIRRKLLTCPYKWYPASQNGRPVNAYKRIRIVFNSLKRE